MWEGDEVEPFMAQRGQRGLVRMGTDNMGCGTHLATQYDGRCWFCGSLALSSFESGVHRHLTQAGHGKKHLTNDARRPSFVSCAVIGISGVDLNKDII